MKNTMKKIIAILVALTLCFSLTACSMSKAVGLEPDEVVQKFEDLEGSLHMKTFLGRVRSFQYVVDGIDPGILLNREQLEELVGLYFFLDGAALPTITQERSVDAFLAVNRLITLTNTDEAFKQEFKDDIFGWAIDVICDGRIIECAGWEFSASVDTVNATITISVK